jgi:hypothetical protein
MNPSFWTGLAAGGAATYFLNRNRNGNQGTTLREPRGPRIDWEDYEDSRRETGRGVAGPSTMGEGSMRRATAFGSSSTR